MSKSRDEICRLSSQYGIDLKQCLSDIDCINDRLKKFNISDKDKSKISTIMQNAEELIKRKGLHETTN